MSATDRMAEAGRKVLLEAFLHLLHEENEFREGDPVKGVHQMRVATRRMRSALRVLGVYYPRRAVRTYRAWLKATAVELGKVRDLDVMIGDLQAFQKQANPELAPALEKLVARLEPGRIEARAELLRWLESRRYRRGLKEFTRFLIPDAENPKTENGREAKAPITEADPQQVRLIIPVILYQHLGAVRAFDEVIPHASAEMLHALRIEFKRLRYILSFFEPVLGQTAADFIREIKQIQDTLGTINDASVAREALSRLEDLSDEEQVARDAYLAYRDADAQERQAHFAEIWAQFNSRPVQRKFADALLALR